MDKDKKSFVFYVEWRDVLMDYPAEVRYEVYDAIIEYAASGKLSELKPLAKMAFSFIKKDMDRNQEKYNGKVETNRENGKKGGAPLGNSNARRKQPKTTETTINENDNDNVNENGNNNPPSIPPCGESADAGKSWREDFDVYKSELKEAFNKIVLDKDFIDNRQKYHPNVDILLSLQKAYEDYWSQEAGWKKKKSSRTKEIDWEATFRKALDQPQNRVYKQKDAYKPESGRALSESQERFAEYLRKEAPMLLEMPIQPTDEEIEILRGMRKDMLLDLLREINNDKYLTTRKNSVFQTIMDLKKKEYGN